MQNVITFDRYQFEKPTKAVNKTNGLAFADIKAMQLTEHGGTTHKSMRPARWVPPWGSDPAKVRRIVAELLWYNSVEGRQPFPVEEFEHDQLAFIYRREDVVRVRAAKTKYNLATMADEARKCAAKEREVAAFGYGKLLLSCVFMCYGQQRYTSSECSQELTVKLSPAGVRQWLRRANTIARRIYPTEVLPLHWTADPARYADGRTGLNRDRKNFARGNRRKKPYRVAEFEAYGLRQEYSESEVADQLGISANMVRVLTNRHRNRQKSTTLMASN